MKDSQHEEGRLNMAAKYIKADNERFSTFVTGQRASGYVYQG